MSYYNPIGEIIGKMLGSLIRGVGEQAGRKIDNIQSYMEKYRSYGDDELMKRLDTTTGNEKIAIINVLRERKERN